MTITKTSSVRKSATIGGTFTASDVYDMTSKKYESDMFNDVLDSYLRNAAEYIVEEGVDYKMGSNVGTLGVRKEKVDFIVLENGKVITNCFVDKLKSNEVNRNLKEGEKPVILRHLDMENILKAVWDKGSFKNATSYYFQHSKTLSKTLYEKSLINDTSKINELHKNRQFNRKSK